MEATNIGGAADSNRVAHIVNLIKSKGLFDEMRKDCLADVDTKPAFQNLRQRVEGFSSKFLSKIQWKPDLNKNNVRDSLRSALINSGMMAHGLDHLVDQVVQQKAQRSFFPKIRDVAYDYLGLPNPQALPPGCRFDRPPPSFPKKVEIKSEDGNSYDVDTPEPKEAFSNTTQTLSAFDSLLEIKQEPPAVPSETVDYSAMLPSVEDVKLETSSEEDVVIKQEEVEVKDDGNDEKSNDSLVKPEESAQKHSEKQQSEKIESKRVKNKSKSSESKAKESKSKETKNSRTPDKDEDKQVGFFANYMASKDVESRVKRKAEDSDESETKRAKVENDDRKDDGNLSDVTVSSVHTSDLSSYDDRISLSSADEIDLNDSYVQDVISKIKKDKNDIYSSTSSDAPQDSPKCEAENKRRKRKMNPKYASKDFSSIFDKKHKVRSSSNDSSSSSEDEQPPKPQVSQSSDSDSSSSSSKSSGPPVNRSPSPIPEKKPKPSSSRSSSNPSSQRYDSSDLYKPRPVIASSSRRSRTASASEKHASEQRSKRSKKDKR